MSIRIVFLLSLFFIIEGNKTVISQQDFDNYRTLLSAGTIPSDFTSTTYNKIKEDLKNSNNDKLSKSKENIFLEGINYYVDEILHSGLVVYGDDVTKYINGIADKLLANETELRGELRFYTLKSNESNAFSTDQGIIFVTTGLISQLVSEAQLAFVLAHEISHYTLKHVIDTYTYKSTGNSHGTNNLSVYSKENEFEADRVGLKWYCEAGYRKEDLLSVFDVLMYSYLPFEEYEFPSTYFNTNNFELPEILFPKTKIEITAIEDYDDESHSHPNIKKRKDSIQIASDHITDWGTKNNLFGEDQFKNIRTICRFESVRIDLLESNYINSIYSIFILEKEFPNSIYLKKLKALTWLGLTQKKLKSNGNYSNENKNDLEGEIATLYLFLKGLDKKTIATIGLRQVYDLQHENKSNSHINAVYLALLKTLAGSESFKLEKYSKKSKSDALKEYKNSLNDTIVKDTLTLKTKNKYDRIKNQKNSELNTGFDSTNFYIYAIPDIVNDVEFTLMFESIKKDIDSLKKQKEENDGLTRKELKKRELDYAKAQVSIDTNGIMVVDPVILSQFRINNGPVKNEKLENDFSLAIKEAAFDAEINLIPLDRTHMVSNGTQCYNDRSILFYFMAQVSNEETENCVPIDFDLLNEIKQRNGTSKAMFTWVNYYYELDLSIGRSLIMLLGFPLVEIIPYTILSGSNTVIHVLIFDIEKGGIAFDYDYLIHDSPKLNQLRAHMFGLFNMIQPKKEKSYKQK